MTYTELVNNLAEYRLNDPDWINSKIAENGCPWSPCELYDILLEQEEIRAQARGEIKTHLERLAQKEAEWEACRIS